MDSKAPARSGFLYAAWAVSLALSLVCAAVFIQGVWRDHRIGEPVIATDFSSAIQASAPFRVSGAGTYRLFVSTVNHDPKLVGVPLGAEFEVAVRAPDGKFAFRQVYAARTVRHAIPDNYGDVELATLALDDWPLRRWSLDVRVLKPDPAFTARSEVKLYKQRYDPGMGGLMNYVMIIPAGAFLLLAFLAAVAVARRGSIVPVSVTSIAAVAFLIAFAPR